MGIAALVTALVLHVHAVQARQQVLTHPVMTARAGIPGSTSGSCARSLCARQCPAASFTSGW